LNPAMLFVSDYGTTWTRTLFVPPCERSFPENEMVRNYLLARYLTSGQFECTQGAGAVWFLCDGDNNSTRIKRVQSWYVLLLNSCCIYIPQCQSSNACIVWYRSLFLL